MLQEKQQELNKDAMKIKKGPNGIKSKRGFQSLVLKENIYLSIK